MNLKALLEKRGALVRELEAYQGLDAPTAEQTAAAKKATADLAELKGKIDEARAVAQSIADNSGDVSIPVPANVRKPEKAEDREADISVHLNLDSARAFTAARFGSRDAAERSAIRAGMWISGALFGNQRAQRWCRDHGVMVQRAANAEDINTDGGYTVPPEMAGDVIRLVSEYGVARRYARVMPMRSNTLNVPKRLAGNTAYFVEENGSITTSNVTFTNVGINAKKLAVLNPFSSEIDEDSVANLADLIVMDAALAFASKEDDCAFNGTGASTYGGMTGVLGGVQTGSVSTATSLTSFATVTDAFVSSAFSKLPTYAVNRAIFCHPEVSEAVFNRLSRAAGGVTRAEIQGGPVTFFNGYPIVTTQVLPNTGTTATYYAVVGDLASAVIFGDRRAMTMQRLVERYAEYDQQAIKLTERFGITYHDRGTSSVAGGVVAMKLG